MALRAAQSRALLAATAIRNRERVADLVKSKVAGGDGTALESLSADASLQSEKTRAFAARADEEIAVHALSVLCGMAPEALTGVLQHPAAIPSAPTPDTSIPADLLARRPDVRIAERNLAAATAGVSVAIASQYPTLTLTGSLTLSGTNPASLLATPILAFGPSVSLPLDLPAKAVGVDAAKARVEQARASWRSAVLKALQDVEDALTRLHAASQEVATLSHAATAAEKADETARTMFVIGSVDFTTVESADQALDGVRDQLAGAEAERATQLVLLYKALGGGWVALR